MHRIVAAVALTLAFLLAACGSAGVPSPVRSPVPSTPSGPTPVPRQPGPDSPDPDPSDAPPPPPSEAPSGTPATPTRDERYLLDGVARGGEDCQPVRQDLPTGAIAGIECRPDDPAIARVGFYLFENEATMLDAYFVRMAAEGIVLESGGCIDGEGEGSYVPYEGTSPAREGCFINAQGYANYRATLPYSLVYIGILGRSDDMAALADFAWAGNQDMPGSPTLWGQPGR